MMRSSQAAFNLIVAEEVTSQAVYTKKYRKPEWPGASSGATIGIGYDLGQTARVTIAADWKGRVSDEMLAAMLSASGITGATAKPVARRLRGVIDIPWDIAIAVHEERVIPRWEAKVAAALPNADKLSPDCFGALLSLTFNRGPSFNNKGERYREMRAIKAHMAAGEFDRIPGELRAMKRLWPNLAGLRRRRDAEAALFAKGLKTIGVVNKEPVKNDGRPPRTDDPIEPEQEPEAPAPAETLPVPLPTPAPVGRDVQGDPDTYSIQSRLKAMNYNPGLVDGKWGGNTAGAISGFINDRHLTIAAPTSIDEFNAVRETLKTELGRAEADSFKRPVSEERKSGDAAVVAEVAPEVVPVKQNFLVTAWGAVAAFFAAIWNALSDHVAAAWNFFSDNKDSIPTDSGMLKTAWSYVASVPSTIWIVLGGIGLVLIAVNSRRAVSKINESVQTGARQ